MKCSSICVLIGVLCFGCGKSEPQVYRAINGEKRITVTSDSELELTEHGANLVCKYTWDGDTMRVVVSALGTQQAIYFTRIKEEGREGLKDKDGVIYYTYTPQDAKIRAITHIKGLETALDSFEIDCGRYPTTAEGLSSLTAPPANLKEWKGPYIGGVPTDPWGNAYGYEFPGKHKSGGYDLHSLGPDGRDGTDDDINNWSDG